MQVTPNTPKKTPKKFLLNKLIHILFLFFLSFFSTFFIFLGVLGVIGVNPLFMLIQTYPKFFLIWGTWGNLYFFLIYSLVVNSQEHINPQVYSLRGLLLTLAACGVLNEAWQLIKQELMP